MNRTLIIRPAAEKHLVEARLWYEKQRTGLGKDFIDSIEDTLNSISRFPNLYPVTIKKIRRALTNRFPYGIFYIVEDERIVVLGVNHQSQITDELLDKIE